MTQEPSPPVKNASLIKKLGVLWGILFLLGGILGFVPGVTKDEMFLGFFMVNTPHNILHMISGAFFLMASMFGSRATRWCFWIIGGLYTVLSIIGFKVGYGLILNLISSSPIDSWGHAFLALVLLLTGFIGLRPSGCCNRGCGDARISGQAMPP